VPALLVPARRHYWSLAFCSDVVEAKILRPRPQPSRPGPSTSRLRPRLQVPEDKDFMHMTRAEIKILRTTSDRIGNELNFDCFSIDIHLFINYT